MSSLPKAVHWDHPTSTLVLLDQTSLPAQERYLRITHAGQAIEAIQDLRVRGAPAIGLAAAWGLVLGLQQSSGEHREELRFPLQAWSERLRAARPTAVNLAASLNRLTERFETLPPGADRLQVLDALKAEASALHAEDEAVGLALGEAGLSLLPAGARVLTHCNAGAIATAGWGTALAPLHLGVRRGQTFRVWVDETRPLLQGSRLTAWELQKVGIPVTLICDTVAASLMAAGQIDAVLVGADRVAANGDVANKIGTLALAVLARHFGVPFYVFAPWSTLDFQTPDGSAIPIETRSPEEVTRLYSGSEVAPQGTPVYNPAFDVTPSELVTALVTERGTFRPPFRETLLEVADGATVS